MDKMDSCARDSSPSMHSEKHYTATTVSTPASTHGSGYLRSLITRWQNAWHRPYATWHPTFLQIRPLAGLLALCIAVACVLTSLAVLVISHDQAVSSWPIQPTVYLAITTAVANAALALAWLEAGPISWWYSASRGNSIAALERQWQVSRSVVQAVSHLQHLRLINIACLATALVVIDGPLLQRASSVVRATQVSDITLELKLPPELPTGFAGLVRHHAIYTSRPQVHLLRDHVTDVPMTVNVTPTCVGTCRAKVLGPGVARSNCSSRTWPITSEMLHSPNATWGPWKSYGLDVLGHRTARLPVFYVRVSPNYDQPTGEAAALTVGLAQWSDWEGSLVETNCFLLPAIVEYEIEIKGAVVNLLQNANQGRVVDLANNTHPIHQDSIAANNKWQRDTMDGITVEVNVLEAANASVSFETNDGDSPNWGPDLTTYNLAVFEAEKLDYSLTFRGYLGYRDPTPDIIFTFNKLMFRGSTMVAGPVHCKCFPDLDSWLDPGISVNQTVSAVHEITHNVFHSDLKWFAGAAALEIVAVLLVLPLFWGWWTLGCYFTMSPFNIALAFDSPVIKDVNSATGSKGVVDKLGTMQVKYGAFDMTYSQNPTGDSERVEGFTSGRLGFGNSQAVVRPRKGLIFRE